MSKSELKGIGGWLLLFILTRTVIGPPWNAFRTYQRWQVVKAEVGNYAQSAEFAKLHQSAWLLYSLGAAIGIATGLILLRSFRPTSVWLAIGGLWFAGILLPLLGYLYGLSVTGERVQLRDLSFMIIQLLSVGFWTGYLMRSKRVQNTYGFRQQALI